MIHSSSDVKTIFGHALDIPSPRERAKYLDDACQGNAALRAEIEDLIGAVSRAGDFLGGISSGQQGLQEEDLDRIGTLIGPYRLLEQIGEGGMGLVYLAEQQQPVRRHVALKIIKPGMDSRVVISRFEAERQALAMMDHPNIAKVLDAGTVKGVRNPERGATSRRQETEGERQARRGGNGTMGKGRSRPIPPLSTHHLGRPYFVMELVKGIPITKYCDQRRLSLQQRLQLFLPVCQAIQHAHQKGIIHRDIKPTNILVALYDGVPVPKVIDFGVAKATAQRLTEKTLFTGFGQLIGTLEYMSPEQARFNQLDIDTRSDIYSLGVVLYELLTGATPFSQADIRTASFDETLRIIREVEPPRPSTKIASSRTLATVGPDRSAEPAQLGRDLQGDLDWIVVKCLEKDRSRRYETASALEMDLRRYLAREPVLARPPSRTYLLRKFVRRNRGPVLSALAVLLALVGGVIGTTWGMIRAGQARQHAVAAGRAEARRAEGERYAKEEAQKRLAQVERGTQTLAAMIRDADPLAAEREGLTLRELLARRLAEAAQQLDGEAFGDPLVVATLQHAVGISLQELGDLTQAEAALVKACETRERLLGADHLDTAATKQRLAMLYRDQAKFDLAETLCNDVLQVHTAKLGPDHPDTLSSHHRLAMLYHSKGEHDLAETLLGEVVQRRYATLGADHADTLSSQHRLALVYRSQARFDLAEALCQEVLSRRIATLGSDNLDTAASKHLLAVLYRVQGYPDLAEPLQKEVVQVRTAKLGADHPDTLTAQHHLALLYASTGKFDLSIPLLEQTLELQKAKLGADHSATLQTQLHLGESFREAGRLAEAIALLEELQQKGREDRAPPRVRSALLGAYLRAGKTTQASALATELLQAARRKFPPESRDHYGVLADAGWTLLDARAFVQAEPLLREAVSRGDQYFPDFWCTHHARLLLGIAVLGQWKFAEAESLLLAGYSATRQRQAQIPPDSSFPLTQAVEWTAELYEAAGQHDKAAEWRRRLTEPATAQR